LAAPARPLGAERVLRALVDRWAVGICTTHDLALAEVVESLGDRAANANFGDRLVGGKLHVEYRLHPSVVSQSNAIELMRAVGLGV
jgi:DNA mismatch repair ATPase MutS